jgi:hypothetical protein
LKKKKRGRGKQEKPPCRLMASISWQNRFQNFPAIVIALRRYYADNDIMVLRCCFKTEISKLQF